MTSRLLLISVILVVAACSEASGKSNHEPSEAGAEATATAPGETDVAESPRAQTPDRVAREPERPEFDGTTSAQSALGDAEPYMDLSQLLHLADVYDGSGLLIDLGTPARLKYTLGNWNSGWQGDLRENGASVSTMGKRARIYLPVDEVRPMQLRIRAKAYASGPLIVYVNGKTMPEATASAGKGFVELIVPVSAASLRPGENSIQLRAVKTRQVKGQARSFAVDWIRFEPADVELATPEPKGLASVDIGGSSRDALTLSAGAKVDWFVEVPRGASLTFATGSADGGNAVLEVVAQTDAKRAGQRERIGVTADWANRRVGLGGLTGQVARVRFLNQGPGEVALADVRVVRPPRDIATIEQPARNVVVVLIDTLRASKLSAYNPKTRVETPALDAFAAAGTVFERPQAPENWTKPSVASVLTSLHPATHGTKEDASKLPSSALTLGEVYQKAGFRTGSFIANGYVSNAFGFDQGWDYYTNYIRERRNTNASNVFTEAGAWIEKNKDKRFFAYIQTIDPHVPYDPPDAFLEKYDAKPYSGQVQNRRTHLMLDEAKKNPKKYKFSARDKERIEALHDGEISYHDEHFGRFLKQLRELGLADDTIVVVTSDHGEEFQDHGSWGHGHSVYQELLGVPLLFRWPGAIPAGARIAPVVSTMDIGPTLLEATGVPIPDVFEGRSLLGFMRGDWPMGPYVAFSDFLEHRRVIRGGDWKLIVRGNLSQVMFDLAGDPGEKTELDGRMNPIAQRYLRTLHGQFLGASDRGQWLAGGSGSPQKRLDQEKQEMTPELCRQLVALGYISAECDAMLKN